MVERSVDPLIRQIHRLDSVPIFNGLNDKQRLTVMQAGRQRKVEAGTFLFMQGDEANAFYLLLDGSVKLSQVTLEGQEIILRYATPGEVFGLIAVLTEQTYPVSAFVVNESQVLVWRQSDMQALISQIPGMALNALQILSGRVKEFQDRIRELSTERVERRVARAVLRLAHHIGKKVPQGVYLDLPISRQDLAEMTGTTLFTVSRTLSKWETMGLITAGREQIIIHSPHGLVCIAEDLPQGDANTASE
jgi:CRP/FNR family transcriptional regulator, nitrogen oxide reductase regulator